MCSIVNCVFFVSIVMLMKEQLLQDILSGGALKGWFRVVPESEVVVEISLRQR